MSVYVLEIKFVALRGTGAVGYGLDEHGREFAVVLDPGLATAIATAIDDGGRPIVAVEKPLYPGATPERVVAAQVVARFDTRATGRRARLDAVPG